MEFLAEVWAWYTDPANWSGNNALPLRLWEHVSLSAASLAAALAIGLPLGLYIGHTGRRAALVVSVANLGRAVPSLGWLGITYPIFTGLLGRGGIGFLPAFVGLAALAVPPVVTNTYAGLREVDPDLRDAARGMGMREVQVLWRVEIPVALPVILAGIRVSAVAVVATATLAALVGGGTLGSYILQGLALSDEVRVFAAAVLVALLSLLTELVLAWVQRRVTSPGLATREERPERAPTDALSASDGVTF